MEKREIRLPLPQNPWTDRHLNLYGWLNRGPLPYATFYQDMITPLRPQICENAHQVTRLVFLVLPSAYSPLRPLHRFSPAIRQMTSFRARMCLGVGVPRTKFYISTQFFPKTQFFLPIFDGTKFRVKKALTMGMLTCKLPLIVIVAQRRLYSV